MIAGSAKCCFVTRKEQLGVFVQSVSKTRRSPDLEVDLLVLEPKAEGTKDPTGRGGGV